MLQITSGRNSRNCQGQSRRTAMKAGFLGCLGLSLSDLLRLQAEGKAGKNGKSVILMWLDGGPSQLETYDPKPDAPPEYRGPFETLQTNVPGMHVSGTLPLHAKLADRMAFIRSIHHDNGDHFAAGHWMLTGRYGSTSVGSRDLCLSWVSGFGLPGRRMEPFSGQHAAEVFVGNVHGSDQTAGCSEEHSTVRCRAVNVAAEFAE